MSAEKTAKRLPFKLAPEVATKEIGNERCGILVFPVYQDLTVSEAAWLASQNAETNAFTYTSKLALKISKVENIEPLDAHAFVAKVLAMSMGAQAELTQQEESMTIKYVGELEECAIKVIDISLNQQNMLVTALIKSRLDGMQDWTVEDTKNMSSELVELIFKFAQQEKNHGEPISVEQINEEMSEQLGKLKMERTKSRKKRTGKKSILDSNISTQETQITPTKDSDNSPATSP